MSIPLRFIHSTYTRARIGRGSIPGEAPSTACAHRSSLTLLARARSSSSSTVSPNRKMPFVPRTRHSMAFKVKHRLAETRTVQQAGMTPRLESIPLFVAIIQQRERRGVHVCVHMCADFMCRVPLFLTGGFIPFHTPRLDNETGSELLSQQANLRSS